MKTILLGTLTAVALALMTSAGCTYYEVTPGVYATSPPTAFDRSWAATVGAFEDQGVLITLQDRSTGQVRGTRGGIDVTANLRTQADGSVRVELNTAGATARDPTLIQRISNAYDRRMGR